MASNMYQYGTSPRKIEPEYNPKRKTTKKPNKKVETQRKNQKEALKAEKKKHHKNIAVIVGLFLLLLTISYRNSLITERFNEIQSKKNQLMAIEKTNGQTEVSIESSLNLKNIEKSAEEKLGMQKLDKDQKVYVVLPKKDYTESATPEIQEENELNWFSKLIEKFLK